MTYKAEREKRMLEMKENAAQSDKVKELNEKITEEIAKGKVADTEKQQLEELSRSREHARGIMRTRDAQRKLNEFMRTHSDSSVQDATTTLTVVADELDRQVAADEKLREETKKLTNRFRDNSNVFAAFNRYACGINPWYRSVDELENRITSQEALNDLKEFFEEYEAGEIEDDGSYHTFNE